MTSCPSRSRADGIPGAADGADELWARVAELPPKQREAVGAALRRPTSTTPTWPRPLECSAGGGPAERPRGPQAPALEPGDREGGGVRSGSSIERALRERREAPARTTSPRAGGDAWPQRADGEGHRSTSPTARSRRRSGTMLVAATERGARPDRAPARELRRACWRAGGPRLATPARSFPRRVDDARRELDEYFAGRRREFDLALDWQLITAPFTCNVLEGVCARSLRRGDHLRRGGGRCAGNPRASRAAGNALGSNPIPVVIPCHRVVRTGGAHRGLRRRARR